MIAQGGTKFYTETLRSPIKFFQKSDRNKTIMKVLNFSKVFYEEPSIVKDVIAMQ